MRPGTRSYLIGLAVLVAGGIACVVLPGLTWATVEVEGRLATSDVLVTGRDLLPLGPAAGLVALAAVVATYAIRRFGRILVGVVLLAAGGAVAAWAGWLSIDLRQAATVWVERAPEYDGTVINAATSPLPAALTAVGGALVAVAGLLTVTRGTRWPAMGTKYDRPATGDLSGAQTATTGHLGSGAELGSQAGSGAKPGRQATSRDVWDALDRGDDPTA